MWQRSRERHALGTNMLQAGVLSLFVSSLIVLFTACCGCPSRPETQTKKQDTGLPPGSWRFMVSGDSRNCGDVVMPAIAAHSAQFAPSFYWHLGDLRAIYKIDEDMAFAAANNHQILSCDTYQRRAWSDFVENQIAPFGETPFFVGIGNHETIPPKTEAAFQRHFADWLDVPVLRDQRQTDKEPAQPEPYYHWIQGGVDFIYLDNASDYFSVEQLTWFQHRLDAAKNNPEVKSVVVGMHEALPDSIANSHSMGDNTKEPKARPTGEKAYKALVAFRDDKRHNQEVYVLASHSHFYMENIFDTAKLKQNNATPLKGWIVGTAGAVRYKLPDEAPATALTDVYGYLLATVSPQGSIEFSFKQIHESDVPASVGQRYPSNVIPWCFAHNSQNREPKAADLTPRCTPPQSSTKPSQSR
jgi:calcineurin-like phosphoesterase family protein